MAKPAKKTRQVPIDANTNEGPHPQPSGGAANAIQAGKVEDLDPNAEVRGRLWYGDPNTVGLSHQMMRDPIVRWCYAGWTGPVVGATWGFEPARDEPAEIEAAKFQELVWFHRNDFLGLLARGSLGYSRDGSVVHELTDDVFELDPIAFPLHPGKSTAIGYTGFHHRARWSIEEWEQSPTNPAQISGFKQFLKGAPNEQPGTRRVSFDQGDLILRITWDQEGSNFDGMPQGRSAWSPFKRKRIYQVIAAVNHERKGVALGKITEPEDTGVTPEEGERDTADEIAANVRSHEQGFVRLPAGWDFDWLVPQGPDSGLRQDSDNCDFEIAFNFGLGWMLLGRSKTGSWALGDVQKGHGILTAQRQARTWEHALNVGYDGFSPVKRLHLLNYGPEIGCPRAVVRYLPLDNVAEILAEIPGLVECGALTLDDPVEDFVRNKIAIAPLDMKSARRRQSERAAAAAIATPSSLASTPSPPPPERDADLDDEEEAAA